MDDAPAGKKSMTDAQKIIGASKPKVKDVAPKGAGQVKKRILALKLKLMSDAQKKGAGGKAVGVQVTKNEGLWS